MKKLALLFTLIFGCTNCFASNCTKYLAQTSDCITKITSKEEYISKYEQQIGNQYVHSIAYGSGYMKQKKHHKCKITYICLLDNNEQPFWGYIIQNSSKK